MRQLASPAAAGRRHKGSLDIAKLEPAIRGTPVVESHHARFFCARSLEPHSETTLNNLEIYETNTSNQSQRAGRLASRQSRTAQAPKFPINGLQLSSDGEKPGEFLRGSDSHKVARLPQIKQ